MDLKKEFDVSNLKQAAASVLDRPIILIAAGIIMIGVAAFLLFGDSAGARNSELALEQGRRAVAQVAEPVQSMRRLLVDEQVQSMAAMALQEDAKRTELLAYIQGRMKDITEVRFFDPGFITTDAASLGESGYMILDMLFAAQVGGLAPVQMIKVDGVQVLASAATIGDVESPDAYLLALADAKSVMGAFEFPLPEAGYIALVQSAGRLNPVTLQEFGNSEEEGYMLTRLTVPGSLFRVVIPQAGESSVLSNGQRLMIFLLGALLLAIGIIRRQVLLRKPVELKEDTEAFPAPVDDDDEGFQPAVMAVEPEAPAGTEPGLLDAPPEEMAGVAGEDLPFKGIEETEAEAEAEEPEETEPEPEEPKEEIVLEDITYDLEQKRLMESRRIMPVELSGGIFRAYDIRGVVGETLDAGVARQVGQAVGSLALERDAGPVVVGRDGRHSGPELVDGMIEGLVASGCDVIDVGAVPTGTLYYAAYELGKGSGVMVTGSHNPPDYNGFKVMIGGDTLFGDAITGLYDSIVSGNLRVGKGEVRGHEVLQQYIERIAGDIQLKKPLKVVADCGNGIGGVCATDVLQAIGAEVLPLYDDVDGDFPNHHPDPSEPHNLEDLINTVKVMDADLGVAFDGDADRLGVVTSTGQIIYSDRLMMLFAEDVLSRHPGETIIYDVKCTGHLGTIIEQAGGVAEMYKTGHSLIKARMKEVDSPFAGEMSGHFFFKDRWYGFDCGIYSAARLLEIIAADERRPEDVWDSLANSVSTPELKIQMQEGENHAFIEKFQQEAEFPGATISTIDGLRADFPGAWGLVRASNTTPILVLRFDADSHNALDMVQEAFREQLLELNPDLELPF